MGTFRDLVCGGKHFANCKLLRATLDALLAKRLPEVELLTAGGPGVPMLAASYATERGLTVTPFVPEFGRFHEEVAVERRDAELVALADAAGVVWDGHDPTTQKLWAMVEARGLPVHSTGEPKARRCCDDDAPEPERRGMLPD